MSKNIKPIILAAILLVFSLTLLAEDRAGKEINWQVLSSGGIIEGSSTNYLMSGTIGQTATGAGSSTNYKLSHGFWQSFATACQGLCGYANADASVDVSDAVWVINYVFVGGDPPQPILACGDANGDACVDVSDAVWVINYVFVGGGPPGDCSPGAPAWAGQDCCPFVR